MDSDEELALQAPAEEDAYAVQPAATRTGLRMTTKVPPQFDGQSPWFEYENLIDDWLGVATLDPDKHGPSLKNALVGAVSFYKSKLANALRRDPDGGLAHFKDTLRPYFVKGMNHVFLWRFLQLFRTYRGQNEFVHWIGRFKIAQKRLLASWSDLLDLADLPEVGTADFLAALTAAQQAEMANLPDDDARRAYQVTLRETTIANRRRDRMAMFPLSDNLMNLIFLVQADLNEQQRERFVSSWGNYEYDWNDWSWYTSDYDADYYGEDTSWYSWAYYASAMDLPETGTSAPVVEGQTDQNGQICFHLCCLFRLLGHGLLSVMINMLMSATLLYRLRIRLYRILLKSIHASDPSDAICTDYSSIRFSSISMTRRNMHV
eukprot:s740_g2.t1